MWDHGGVAWAIGLGALLGFDVALIATGHHSMSSHARNHRALTAVGLGVLTFHLFGPKRAAA